MGLFRIEFKVTTTNLEAIEELRMRLSDFSLPFANIIAEWARGNTRKFAQGKGAENTGATVDGIAQWQPLSGSERASARALGKAWGRALKSGKHAFTLDDAMTPYQRSKRRKGYENWLMKATGDLMASLSSTGMFASFVDARRAVFGTPLNSEDADKALYNSDKRPTIFLGRSDQNMIRREMQRYLSMGDNYREMMFAKASRLQALRDEMGAMDAEYAEAVNG